MTSYIFRLAAAAGFLAATDFSFVAAPWFLATLDKGNYTADVVARGQYGKSVDFNVSGDGQTRVVVPFPQITGT